MTKTYLVKVKDVSGYLFMTTIEIYGEETLEEALALKYPGASIIGVTTRID